MDSGDRGPLNLVYISELHDFKAIGGLAHEIERAAIETPREFGPNLIAVGGAVEISVTILVVGIIADARLALLLRPRHDFDGVGLRAHWRSR